jgi:hypothetical protein
MTHDGLTKREGAFTPRSSDLAQAKAIVAEARAWAPVNPGHLAHALHALATAERDAGHQIEVVRAAEEALLLDKGLDALQILDLRLLLAQALSELSLDGEALHEAQVAFDAARLSHSYAPTMRALSVLGALYGRMGEQDQAHELLMQALSRARDLQDAAATRTARNNLVGFLSAAAVRPNEIKSPSPAAKAQLHLHASALWLSLDDEPDNFRRLTMGVTAAYGLVLAGDLKEGLSRLQACTDQAEAHGFEATLMKGLGGLGHAHLLQLEPDQARVLLLRCLETAQRLGNGPALICAHEGLSAACGALGDAVQAEWHAQAAEHQKELRERQRDRDRAEIEHDRATLRNAMACIDQYWAAGV